MSAYLNPAVMNYSGFLFALVLVATGIGIAEHKVDDETQPGSRKARRSRRLVHPQRPHR